MIRILCICGNGMGTSTLLKINLKKIASNHNVDVEVNSCAAGEAMGYINNCDLIITTPEWAKIIPQSCSAKITTTKNLINIKELDNTFVNSINKYFGDKYSL
ncbi:PTS sugar transporter subunit IIB [Oceanivirga salmonicida]|uniref:PTS sugar transporter subunit IIB n=1 Tax=Oceanivirga salmonicida TaxID=1769291 RepID=UPI00083708CC|nr:hypothetical protein [Oceanivirga salmonicida]